MSQWQTELNSARRRQRCWCGSLLAMAVLTLSACRPSASVPNPPAEERPREVLCIHSENNGALWLVQMETVARELQLTEEQQTLFALWSREANLQSGRIFASLSTTDPPANEEEIDEARQKSQELVKGFHQKVVDALEAHQIRRLDELCLRSLGPRLFFFQPLVSRLEITEAQKSELHEVLDDDDRSHEKLLTVLTPAQRDALDKLLGEPFNFPTPKFMHFSAE